MRSRNGNTTAFGGVIVNSQYVGSERVARIDPIGSGSSDGSRYWIGEVGRLWMRCANRGGGGGVLRRTRSSHPWSLSTRHPWRVTSGVTRRHRRLMSRVHRALKRAAHFTRTDSFSAVSWMGCPSAVHSSSTLPSRRRSPNEVARSSSFGWRRFGASDHHAPWMARGERPWMARACPPHRTSVTRTPSEGAPRSSEPMSNAQHALERYRFS